MNPLPLNTPVRIHCPDSAVHGRTGRISNAGYGGYMNHRREYMVLLDTPWEPPEAHRPIHYVGPFVKSRLRVIPAVTDVVQWRGEMPEPVPCEPVEGDGGFISIVNGEGLVWRRVKQEKEKA